MKRLALLGVLGLLALGGCGSDEGKTTCNHGTHVFKTDNTEDANGDTTVTVTCTDGKTWEVG